MGDAGTCLTAGSSGELTSCIEVEQAPTTQPSTEKDDEEDTDSVSWNINDNCCFFLYNRRKREWERLSNLKTFRWTRYIDHLAMCS